MTTFFQDVHGSGASCFVSVKKLERTGRIFVIKTAKLNEVLLIVDVDSVEIKEGESQGEGWRRAKGISIGITQISSVKRDEAAIRGQRVKGPHLEVEANMRRS